MGRDVSVVSTHPASLNPQIRSIVDADNKIADAATVRFTLKPHKVFLFDAETEERIRF
jgi:multiple sugar transport system ATP-binding protein